MKKPHRKNYVNLFFGVPHDFFKADIFQQAETRPAAQQSVDENEQENQLGVSQHGILNIRPFHNEVTQQGYGSGFTQDQ